ncbi:MAG TPA: hypothetical protein VG675_04330 [Bryobacteraceae bacterium]|nr:hypothetical protein [Bryobacteraceae bacterium]
MLGRNPFLFPVVVLTSLLALPGRSASELTITHPTATNSLQEKELLSQNYVNQKLAIWQKRLNLDDWKITIVMSHPSDLRPKTLGNIHWDADTRTAVIRVLDAADYTLPQQDMLDDMEFTVVHELIHLELSSLPRSQASRSDEEHAVNRLAQALLDLDRRDRR